MEFKAAVTPLEPVTGEVTLILFIGNDQVVTIDNCLPTVPVEAPILDEAVYLGTLANKSCFALRSFDESELSEDWNAVKFKTLHDKLDQTSYALLGHASQILTWRENHNFCSKCGAPTAESTTERSMTCISCGFMSFPRISPSIIVAVTRGEELLMVRSPHFPEGLYSVVAGFLEPGETLEQCVEREVLEETGIKVKNIRYVTSQPWAFPHSLMCGFTADYAGGELVLAPGEIEDGGWYTPATMPTIPDESTIARRLINTYLKGTP